METNRAGARARAYARRMLHDAVAGTRGRLPSVRRMAADAGVAPLTMWKAVRELAREGAVVTRQGSGVRPAGVLATVPSPGLLPCERARQALETDIVAGVYRFATHLPSAKELTARYGVAYRTLHKALRVLDERRLVAVSGRWYRVNMPHRGPRDTVVLVARGARGGGLELPTPRMEQQLRVLHAECARAGVALKAYGAQPSGDSLVLTAECERVVNGRGAGAVLGSILWSTSLPYPGVVLLGQRLASTGRPVALLDEGGQFSTASFTDAHSGIRVFTTSNSPESGLAMGRFLHMLGHRRVVYLTLWPTVGWSLNREQGLRQVFGLQADREQVTRVAPPVDVEVQVETLDRLDRFLAALRTRGQDRDAAFVNRLYRALRGSSAHFQAALHWQDLQDAAGPLYPRACAVDGATAWVAANDLLALGALRFLAARNRTVPRTVSVVGFDDTPEAFAAGLTSYNFNQPAIAHAMLYHILGPMDRRGLRPGPVELEGFVSARDSSATPPLSALPASV